MSLLLVPRLDRGVQAIFRQYIVPAFQRIRRCSQGRNCVPLEERVVCSEYPSVVWPAGIIAFCFIRTETWIVNATVRFRRAVTHLGILAQIWLVSATDGVADVVELREHEQCAMLPLLHRIRHAI